MLDNRKVIIDDDLLMAQTVATLSTASAGTVDGVAKVLDTGGGYTEGKMVVDVDTLAMAGVIASHSIITVALEGSSTTAFTTYTRLARIRLDGTKASARTRYFGDSTVASSTTGRYIVPFINDYHGTVYRYLRVYTIFDGTIAGGTNGIIYKAWLTK